MYRPKFIAAALASVSVAAVAGETVNYSYDALGRLTVVARSGTINNGVRTDYQFDPASNRTRVTTAGSSGTAPPSPGPTPPPPPPPPPPGPTNQPPNAVADTLSVPRCATRTKNVTANDTDPEGNLPLEVIAVSPAFMGDVGVTSSSSITFMSTGTTGTEVLTYTVRDSLGAASTGTLTVTVGSGVCQ